MKIQNSIIFSIIVLLYQALAFGGADYFVVDEVKACVFSEKSPKMILKSDLSKSKNLRDAFLEELMLSDADKSKLLLSEAELDQVIGKIKKNYKNISKEDAQSLSSGPLREQIRKKSVIDRLISQKITNRMKPVTIQDAERYLEAHPKKAEKSFVMALAKLKEQCDKKEIEKKLADEKYRSEISWNVEFTVKKSEVKEGVKLSNLEKSKPGDIILVEKIDGGFKVIKFVRKIEEHVLSLYKDQEKKKINRDLFVKTERRLMSDRYKKSFDEYLRKLLSNSSVIFANEKEKEDIFSQFS